MLSCTEYLANLFSVSVLFSLALHFDAWFCCIKLLVIHFIQMCSFHNWEPSLCVNCISLFSIVLNVFYVLSRLHPCIHCTLYYITLFSMCFMHYHDYILTFTALCITLHCSQCVLCIITTKFLHSLHFVLHYIVLSVFYALSWLHSYIHCTLYYITLFLMCFMHCHDYMPTFTALCITLPCFACVYCRDYIIYLLHCVGASRCEKLNGCQQGCAAGGKFDGIPKITGANSPDEQKKC